MIETAPPGTERGRLTRLAAACCSWLVCSPAPLAADTRAKRLADRVLPGPGWPAGVYFAVVVALLGFAPHLSARLSLTVSSVACLAGGAWCAVNFWRCRHAHCLITGAGWLALAAVALLGAALGHSVIGGTERLVFLGVLAVGVLFEAFIYLTRGSYALTARDACEPLTRRHASAHRPPGPRCDSAPGTGPGSPEPGVPSARRGRIGP